MIQTLHFLANIFPVWVVVCSLLAFWQPRLFDWFQPYIVPGLGVIMLGMGLTLSGDDFRQVFRMPRPIFVGVAGQFLLMPLLGWSLAHLMQLPKELAVGLILVSCCPGGTASNVVTYIARANLALSLLMTMCSTFAAIALTPLLTKLLAGQLVPVDAYGLFVSTVQVVLLPVLAGLALHHALPRLVDAAQPVAPLVAVITIAFICANIIGNNADAIRQYGLTLILAVCALHAGAFLLGYGFAWLFGYDELIRRTVSIEVGMQNSGLGTVLAKKHFASPLTGVALAAVPCALSAVCHSVIGSLLAAFWRMKPPGRPPKTTTASI
jgi:BASS family bile acid:Na+ symporter